MNYVISQSLNGNVLNVYSVTRTVLHMKRDIREVEAMVHGRVSFGYNAEIRTGATDRTRWSHIQIPEA